MGDVLTIIPEVQARELIALRAEAAAGGKWPEKLDQDWDAWPRVRQQARRCITLGCKAGRRWDQATTVGTVAKACKLPLVDVVRIISACAWLMEVAEVEGKPLTDWIVWEDGE